MTNTHGFTLVEEREVPELRTMAKLYRHDATGAELLSMESDDENKTFGITFRTPPTDSTGVPHIMEHSVLCGSRKYPVKEPFVELMKSSLQTFLNAMTYPDKTCYPVASQNLQDFYNLVDVYLDAVFYPRITPEILQQEGWHYDLDEPSAPMTYKGVVFNEMKGVYSSPDSLIAEYSQRSVFPDNTYGLDSGGDPTVIPDLTYAQFKDFHDTYYHPSNARIYFYGDDDPEERLRIVQEWLKEFNARPIDSRVELQASSEAPGRVVHSYPAGEDAENQKMMLTVNWLLPENVDQTVTFSLQMLSHILLSTSASPLRKALIESGLGEGVIGGGIDASLRQLTCSAGLKGIDPANVDRVEELILSTLAELVENGIDPNTTEAAVNTIEFGLREQNFGSYPKGLVLMITALTTWLHDGDPIGALEFKEPLAQIKSEVTPGNRYFESLIRKHLLDNPHRMTVVLEPDPELQQKWDVAEKERLAAAKSAMSEEDIEGVVEQTRLLRELQERPDAPEDLARIPRLNLEDLDTKAKPVPLDVSETAGAKILYHDLFTNGIVYLGIGFDLHKIPQELLPYVGMFSEALLELGTETEDYVRLTQRIGQKTGGIHPVTFTAAQKDSDTAAAWLFLHGKSTVDHTGDLLDILRDILLTVKLDNPERFRQILLEAKAGKEASLIPAGHSVVASRLRAKFNEASWAAEQMGGVSQLFMLRELVELVENDWPGVLQKLEAVREAIVNRDGMLCNVTLDAENWASVQPQLAAFLETLPSYEAPQVAWAADYSQNNEGLTLPANVNYVAKGNNIFNLGYQADGSLAVITNYLRSTWLWEKIRVQGGAYGAFCSFDQHSGIFVYASYRDPNLRDTIDNYDGTSTFLRNLDLSEDELTKSIIGAIGSMDAPQLPDAKGYSSMARYLVGYTDEMRQEFRDQALSTSASDFKAFGDVLAQLNDTGLVVVLGSQAAIEAANQESSIGLELTKVL